MIYLAYDGTLNGDWVARYAMRLALHGGKVLDVIHVLDGSQPEEECHAACERLIYDGSLLGVEIRPRLVEHEKSILHSLQRVIPGGTEHLVVCGTRMRPRQKSYLSGTLAEQLLHGHRFATLALRVVHPGLLGSPRDLLLPILGPADSVSTLTPFFHLITPDLTRIEILRGIEVNPLRLHHLTAEQLAVLRETGERDLAAIRTRLFPRQESHLRIDGRTLICSDWVHEIALQASRLKSHMILIGTQQRSLPRRMILKNPLERLLHHAPCDVAVYRTP